MNTCVVFQFSRGVGEGDTGLKLYCSETSQSYSEKPAVVSWFIKQISTRNLEKRDSQK